MKTFKILIISMTIALLAVGQTNAAGGDSYGANSRLAPFLELIEAEKYREAIEKLNKALKENAEDADLLNLIAFSHRKLGDLETAYTYYQKALGIEPDHRGANEYLGELYLQMGQLDKALERLAVLDKDCFFGCDEFDDLEAAIKAYRKANP